MKRETFREIEYQAWSDRASQYDKLFASVTKQAIGGILESLGPLQGKRHLDVASGTGHLVAAASNQGAISEGIDFSPAMVAVARTNYPGERFQVADATDLPYQDQGFDLVTCSFGLTHMENPQAAADEVFRVLKPGGRFTFTLWFGPEHGNQPRALIKTALEKHALTDFTLPQQWTQLRNADKRICEELTLKSGFVSPAFKRLTTIWQANSVQEAIDLFFKLSVRNQLMIERLSVEVQGRVYEQLMSEVESRKANGAISFNLPALLIVVKKPLIHKGMEHFGQIETKYTLFDSLEDMLAPKTLSELSGKSIQHVHYYPMKKQGGSGSQLMTVEAESNPRKVRYVIKRLSKSVDWMMVAGEDHQCRSVTLWQSGLLDQLKPKIDHAILACARDGDGWAILMRDVSESLIEIRPYTSAQVRVAIESLSAIHATFWEHPALEDPSIGLCDISGMLWTLSPQAAQRHQNVPGLPDWWSDWIIDSNALLLELLAPDVADVLAELKVDPQPLIKALESGPRTLLHGDYGFHNLGLRSNGEPKIYLFDWGLAGYGLPTVDLGWFLDLHVSRSVLQPNAAISYYRQCLEQRLGDPFEDETWQRWQELGRLAHILRLGIAPASNVENWETEEEKPIFRQVVNGYNQQVRAALKWL